MLSFCFLFLSCFGFVFGVWILCNFFEAQAITNSQVCSSLSKSVGICVRIWKMIKEKNHYVCIGKVLIVGIILGQITFSSLEKSEIFLPIVFKFLINVSLQKR